MALIKKQAEQTLKVEEKAEPVVRVQTIATHTSNVKGRDFDAEARGKTRCVAFGDALKSPHVANAAIGLSEEEFLALVERIANRHVKYTFGE
jgi:hypothetical protein